MKTFWKDEIIPVYCYYELLEHLFHKLLNGKIKNKSLLNRVLDFMEEMATSDDIEVQNLLQVQILESLFGLEYTLFNNMEKTYSVKILKSYKRQKYFIVPKSP